MVAVSLTAITAATFLLRLPFATHDRISWFDAVFTATSAFTVTGLNVVDIGTTFTIFGQLVILLLVKFGGIGIMTFAILAFMMLGKKIGFKERLMIQHTLNQDSLGGILKLVKSIFLYAIMIEAIATMILSFKWVPVYGFTRGLYYSFFHAVSAFNNAGISIFTTGFSPYTTDLLVSLVITTLFIIGGIGFTVLIDIKNKRSFKKLSLHSKIMIIGTLVFNLTATLIFIFLEANNPATLGSVTGVNQVVGAYFQATSTRTAGFGPITIDYFRTPTTMMMLFLMFIGSGSAATSGGIKLTTFVVIVLSSITFIRGKKQVTLAKRTIKERIIIRAFTILSISFLLIFSSLFLLAMTEQIPTNKLLFEVISAFSTVGLSMGVTENLSNLGRGVIMSLMFFGKIGPLTLAFSLASASQDKIIYPSEDILTG